MIIELPEKFSYANKKDFRKCAKVKNGILCIKSSVDFEELMYSLTYALKGKRKCYYCNEKVAKEKITLDHMYPKAYGGMSITNNLQPACSRCNNEKSNMNYNEYRVYRSLPEAQKADFLKCIANKKEEIKREIGYDLPKEWITMAKVSALKVDSAERIRGKVYDRVKSQYEQYGTFRKPIITDRNLYVLNGYNTYCYAVENGIKLVPIIVLENVRVDN